MPQSLSLGMLNAPARTPTSRSDGPGLPEAPGSSSDEDLFRRLRAGEDALREQLVERYLPLAQRLARRYHRPGEGREDLEQVASVGLLKAIDRYDPDVGPFVGYAVPNITGELKRHFRDRGWGVHVPRSVQENFLKVNDAIAKLSGELRRSPTPQELAEEVGLELDAVIEALDVGSAYSPATLDAPLSHSEDSDATLGDTLGSEDRHYDYVELGEAIGPAFRALPRREQQILHMRFLEDRTQSDIAAELGISQMHVSRLLRRSLEQLESAADGMAEQEGS